MSVELQPYCHFTAMEFCGGEHDESWWECKHCGHTVQETPENGYEK